MLVPSQVLLHPSRIVYSVPSLAAMKTIVSLTILSRDADGQDLKGMGRLLESYLLLVADLIKLATE
ncbi:hypothetical protein JHK87_028074 [Glycine soja]|nr:hypothetical protein JHK87_028074 [Glycine soja]